MQARCYFERSSLSRVTNQTRTAASSLVLLGLQCNRDSAIAKPAISE